MEWILQIVLDISSLDNVSVEDDSAFDPTTLFNYYRRLVGQKRDKVSAIGGALRSRYDGLKSFISQIHADSTFSSGIHLAAALNEFDKQFQGLLMSIQELFYASEEFQLRFVRPVLEGNQEGPLRITSQVTAEQSGEEAGYSKGEEGGGKTTSSASSSSGPATSSSSTSSSSRKPSSYCASLNGEEIHFARINITRDGHCGFTALEVSRSEVKGALLSLSDREEVRERLCEEVYEAFMTNAIESTLEFKTAHLIRNEKQDLLDQSLRSCRVKYENLPDLLNESDGEKVYEQSIQWLIESGKRDDAEHLRKAFSEREEAIAKLKASCKSKAAYLIYCGAYLKGLWLGCESAIIYAQKAQFSLYIWEKLPDSSSLSLKISVCNQPKVIHLLYSNGNHFDRLIPQTGEESSFEISEETSSLEILWEPLPDLIDSSISFQSPVKDDASVSSCSNPQTESRLEEKHLEITRAISPVVSFGKIVEAVPLAERQVQLGSKQNELIQSFGMNRLALASLKMQVSEFSSAYANSLQRAMDALAASKPEKFCNRNKFPCLTDSSASHFWPITHQELAFHKLFSDFFSSKTSLELKTGVLFLLESAQRSSSPHSIKDPLIACLAEITGHIEEEAFFSRTKGIKARFVKVCLNDLFYQGTLLKSALELARLRERDGNYPAAVSRIFVRILSLFLKQSMAAHGVLSIWEDQLDLLLSQSFTKSHYALGKFLKKHSRQPLRQTEKELLLFFNYLDILHCLPANISEDNFGGDGRKWLKGQVSKSELQEMTQSALSFISRISTKQREMKNHHDALSKAFDPSLESVFVLGCFDTEMIDQLTLDLESVVQSIYNIKKQDGEKNEEMRVRWKNVLYNLRGLSDCLLYLKVYPQREFLLLMGEMMITHMRHAYGLVGEIKCFSKEGIWLNSLNLESCFKMGGHIQDPSSEKESRFASAFNLDVGDHSPHCYQFLKQKSEMEELPEMLAWKLKLELVLARLTGILPSSEAESDLIELGHFHRTLIEKVRDFIVLMKSAY